MSAVETLTARHQEADAQPQGPGLSIMPSLRTMIIGCVDPRVDPVFVLGLNPGEAAVLRNVGGRVTPGAVREMAMLQEVARAHGARPGEASTSSSCTTPTAASPRSKASPNSSRGTSASRRRPFPPSR